MDFIMVRTGTRDRWETPLGWCRGWNRRVQKAGAQGGKRQGWGIVCVRVYARQTLGSFFGEGLTGSLSLNELPFLSWPGEGLQDGFDWGSLGRRETEN